MRITQSGKVTPSIAPSRACAWFENKRFDWPSVSFFDHWPIRLLGLFPLFCTVFKKTALLLTNQNGEIFSCILLSIIIHQTQSEKSDWSRAFSQFTIACELDIRNVLYCCRYYIYRVKFNVCLVTKPLGVFSSETKWLNASLLFVRMNYVKNV